MLATGQGFDELIVEGGLTARPLSIDFRKLLESPEIQAALTSLRGKLAAYRAMKHEVVRQYEEMWATIRDVQPDLLVVSPKGFPAVPMARLVGIPCVATTLQPNFVPRGDFPQFLFSRTITPWGNRASYRLFNRLTILGQNLSFGAWAKNHLPPDSDVRLDGFHGFHPGGKRLPLLQGFSRHLVPMPDDWSETSEPITGYWFRPPANAASLPLDLEQFLSSGPTPIYIGFGSMPAAQAEFLAAQVRRAVELLGLRAVLSVGWGALQDAVSSPDIHVIDAAPFELIFPRCAAVVHHGGAGTTHEGLRWGRPAVICPAGVDQPFWARRLEAIGVAGPALPLDKLRADRLARSIESALEPRRVARAAQIGEAVSREDGAARAADILDRIAL